MAAHTVLFPHDYGQEFRDLFDMHRCPQEPSVYCCAQYHAHGRGQQPSHAPLFLMANAPNASHLEPEDTELLKARVLKRLQQHPHFPKQAELIWQRSPQELAKRFPGSDGALYGAASNGWMSAFQRPPNRVNDIRGLYLATGSAHPGGGMPLSALSGYHAAQALMQDSSKVFDVRTWALPS